MQRSLCKSSYATFLIEIPFKCTESQSSDGAAAKTIQNLSFKWQIIPPNLQMSSHYNIEILL